MRFSGLFCGKGSIGTVIAGSLQVSNPKNLTVVDGAFLTNNQALWADFTISGVG